MKFENAPSPESTGPNEDVARVDILPAIGEIRISGLAGSDGAVEDRTIRAPSTDDITTPAERLQRIYETVGPGDHNFTDLVQRLGSTPSSLGTAANRLAKLLPNSLFEYTQSEEPKKVRLGRMALRLVEATEQEKADFEARVEATKVDLSIYDHAVVGFRDRRYYFELDERAMFLAVRVIDAIAEMKSTSGMIKQAQLTRMVWDAMPLTERRLFCEDEERIRKRTVSAVIKNVHEILEGLTGRMGITRRGAADDTYHLPQGELSVTVSENVMDFSKNPQLILAFPEGSPHSARMISGADKATANELIEILRKPDAASFDQSSAIDVLDKIMDPSTKRALTFILESTDTNLGIHDALAALHEIVERNLGRAQCLSAWTNRMIGGHLYRRRARQSGGRLPGDQTNQRLGVSLHRWTLYDQEL